MIEIFLFILAVSALAKLAQRRKGSAWVWATIAAIGFWALRFGVAALLPSQGMSQDIAIVIILAVPWLWLGLVFLYVNLAVGWAEASSGDFASLGLTSKPPLDRQPSEVQKERAETIEPIPHQSTQPSDVPCKGCGEMLPELQVKEKLGNPAYSQWCREGYCSYPCFEKHARKSRAASAS